MRSLIRLLSLFLILSDLLKNFDFISNFKVFCSNFYNHLLFFSTFQIFSHEYTSLKSFVKKLTDSKSISDNLPSKNIFHWHFVKINPVFSVKLLYHISLTTFVILPHIIYVVLYKICY